MSSCVTTTRTALQSNFGRMPITLTTGLRTLLVGPDYAYYPYNISNSQGYLGVYNPSAGLVSAWPVLPGDEAVDLTRVTVVIDGVELRYFAETGTPGAANGVQNGVAANQVVHDAGVTVWAGASRSAGVITDVVIGDAVLLDDSLGNTLVTTVRDFVYTAGKPNILVLDDNLPAALTGGAFFNINISQVIAGPVELPASDFTASATQVSLAAGITFATDRTAVAVPLVSGLAYTSYRSFRLTNAGAVVEIADTSELATYFEGYDSPDSVLGFAVRRALAPTMGPAVLALAIASDDPTGWADALAVVRYLPDWYTLCALTTDEAVLNDISQTLLPGRTAIGFPSRLICGLELTDVNQVFSGSEAITLSGADLIITASNGIFAGAVANDSLTTNNGVYVIATVVSNQQVIVTLPATGSVTVTLVVHTLSKAEQALDYGARAQAFADRDVSVVFPPNPTWGGEIVGVELLAAAVAGLRGFAPPQQPLTSVALETGWAVEQSDFEFRPYLDLLAAYGCTILSTCNGYARLLSDNTTDQSSDETATESVVANVDAVSRYFNTTLSAYEGVSKVVYETLLDMRTSLYQDIQVLQSATILDEYGATIVSGTVGQPEVSTSNADDVVVPVEVVVAKSVGTVQTVISVVIR